MTVKKDFSKEFTISNVEDHGSYAMFSLQPRRKWWERALVWIGMRTLVPLMDWAERTTKEHEEREKRLREEAKNGQG